ncbi:SRPBCC family protein [Streptomyces sp. M19]
MDWCHYRFRSRWDLDAPPRAVYAVLAVGEEYPLWWPQVREATRVDASVGTARIRSLIPYDLVITLGEMREDRAAGLLESRLGGDLEGWARWTVTAHGTGTRAVFEQDVVARKPLLRRLAVPGRPLFRANHALMMRAGRRGLRRRLAGTRREEGRGSAGGAGAV